MVHCTIHVYNTTQNIWRALKRHVSRVFTTWNHNTENDDEKEQKAKTYVHRRSGLSTK